ncbi:MAG: thioredoxin family protein [Muribaculaceae bacterium]|nr:thioredoxin family protein [Muribaculaceae bacterium]
MKLKPLFLLIVAATISLAASAQNGLKKVYDDTLNPLEQIDKALEQARHDDKFVVCQLGGNWCPWCLRLAHFISSDETLNKLVDDNFVYIHVSYNPHDEATPEKAGQNALMLQRLGNPSRFGYPVLIVLDGEGHVLHIQDSGYLEEGKGYDMDKVTRFFRNWSPAAVRQH